VTLFDAEGLPCRIAGEVKGFEPELYIDAALKPRKRMARAAQFAVAATTMALQDAGLDRAALRSAWTVPVVIGVSTSSMDLIDRPPMPWTPVATCPHAVTSAIAYAFDMQARIVTISDGCTSGMDALSVAWTQVRSGMSPLAIAGASVSASISRHAISTPSRNRQPRRSACTSHPPYSFQEPDIVDTALVAEIGGQRIRAGIRPVHQLTDQRPGSGADDQGTSGVLHRRGRKGAGGIVPGGGNQRHRVEPHPLRQRRAQRPDLRRRGDNVGHQPRRNPQRLQHLGTPLPRSRAMSCVTLAHDESTTFTPPR
jgi:hypothetical protein